MIRRADRRRTFLLCWLTYAGFYLGRVNLAMALPAIQAEFQWPKTAIGLIGTVLFWSYACGQLLMGYLGDRLSARRMVAVGLAVSALLNLAFGSLGALWAMIIVWGLNGWAQATGWGPMMKTLSRRFTPSQRPRLTAFFAPCYVVGHAASWALAGLLVGSWGWRSAFWVPGVLLVLLASVWYLLARDAPPSAPDPPFTPADPVAGLDGPALPSAGAGISAGGVAHSLLGIVRTPRLRWALGACFCLAMVRDSLIFWGPTYLVEVQHLSIASAALTSLLIPVSGILGTLIAAWLLHRVGGQHEAPVIAGLALLMAAALAAQRLSPFTGQWVAPAMFALVALTGQGMYALLTTSLPLSRGPEGEVATVAGVLDFFCYLGSGLSAALVGGLQESYGWSSVFLCWLGLALVIALLALGERSAARLTTPLTSG